MSVDNRTEINDCNAITGWVGDGGPGLNTLAGQRYEGSGSIDGQHSNADEETYTTEDSLNTGTFSLDWSDSTLYMMAKDNLVDTAANGGVQFLIGDSTDRIAYDVGGNDAVGMPITPFFNVYKLDVSNRPANFTVQAGVEANLTTTAITEIGYGSLHLAKAQGNVPNIFLDYYSYIANGSYALTINAGTAGSPIAMSTVAADDITNGRGMNANPLGKQYIFFAPTEWGNSSTIAEHAFKADGEQWFWVGDNAGGQAVGANNFPFRLISNATDTGSFIIDNVVVVNTGTRAQFLMDNTDFDTIEIDGCSFSGLGTISLPSSGGTSRFCTKTIFSDCDQITHNGANMSNGSVLVSNVAVDTGALLYNETTDPDTLIDGVTFSKGTNAHHAIDFGTLVTANITLRNCIFNGFGSTDDSNDSTVRFLAASGSLTLNLVGCTVDGVAATTGNFSIDDAAGITVTLSINPITETVNVKDNNGNNLQNARVLVETAATITSGEMFEAAVTSLTQTAGTATCTTTAVHGLATNDYVVIRGAQPDDYNKAAQVTVSSTTVFTYAVTSGISSPATGTPVVSFAALSGLTDVSGNISATRVWGAAQSLKGWARLKNTSGPFYKEGKIAYNIDTTNGNTTNVVLQLDE